MITISKILALIGLCAPKPADDSELVRQFRRVRIAQKDHDKISEQATASGLNIIYRQEIDTSPAETLRDAKSMEETVDAIVREMQGRA